ncbi:MAG: methyltransferase domain-containing protein [Anaerolineae bacterium]|nr:class I SAM-dependent methyltransferase [Anaerolineae bacterium]MDW8298999.1 methyltransferase domain-containing protein [Anaerolineae bacterium]
MEAFDSTRLTHIYRQRFGVDERASRNAVWRVLCRHFFQRFVPPEATVLDLAAGNCEFINNIQAAEKIAVDLNEDTRHFAAPEVRVVIAYSHDMAEVASESVDVVFVSNFFEHLPDKNALLATLSEIRRVLRHGGKLLILQPNIRLLKGAYWDFIDHLLPLTHHTLAEALELAEMPIEYMRVRFLPYTTRSRLPRAPWLVWLYLHLRPAQWLLGKQTFIIARKP